MPRYSNKIAAAMMIAYGKEIFFILRNKVAFPSQWPKAECSRKAEIPLSSICS